MNGTMRDDLLIRLRRRLTAARRGERGSAMVMALILILVFAVASIVLATVVGVNARLTLQTSSRGISVYVAEAGLETTLGMFRAATTSDDTVHGVLKNLPCQVTGSADGSSDTDKQFEVTISYGMENPAAHATDADWLAATNTGGDNPNGFTPVSCTPGSGPSTQPYYALVEAKASQGEVGARTLLAVYSFNIDTSNATGKIGGEIFIYTDATLCLRADSATAGSLIHYSKNCDRTNASDSVLLGWTYDSDYKIRLASTIPADDPSTPANESLGGLCIAAPTVTPTVTTTTTVVEHRWDYDLPKIGSGSSAWPAITGSTSETVADQALPNPLDTTYKQSNGSTGHRYYYVMKGSSFTAGSATAPKSVTPKSGETSRTESYVQYKGTYANSSTTTTSSNTTGSNLTTTSTSYYLRYVTATVTKTVATGGDYVGQGSYGSNLTASAVLVDCGTYNATDGSGNVTSSAGIGDLQWGWEAANSWKSANGWCLYSGHDGGTTTKAGDTLSAIQNCAISSQDAWAAYNPLTGVGAGNASGATAYSYGGRLYSYLVSFKEFGRCADVNGENYQSRMIVYPCKQDPNNPTPERNQGWSFVEPTDPDYISTTNIFIRDSKTGGTEYCLVEPSGATGVYSSGVGSPRVELVKNTGSQCNQNAAKWTRYTWTGRYASSYIFVSYSGLCLTADSTTSDTTTSFPWSTITVQGCNGQSSQKWNAPPDLPLGGLGDYQEIPAGGDTP